MLASLAALEPIVAPISDLTSEIGIEMSVFERSVTPSLDHPNAEWLYKLSAYDFI
jgi:hypothetical protein